MSNFKPVDGRIGVQPIASVSTTQLHPLGTRIRAVDETYGEGEFVYVKGVTSGAVGSVVLLNPDDWSTSLAVADDIGSLGVLMAALDASTDFGWAQVYGKGAAKVLTGFLDGAACYLTSTDGSVDDTDVAGDYIDGMKGASAVDTPSTGLAEVELHYPRVNNALLN